MTLSIKQCVASIVITLCVAASQFALAAVTVPAGTSFLVRTSQTLSTDQVSPGYRFTTRLEADLVADGQVVAPRAARFTALLPKPRNHAARPVPRASPSPSQIS